MESSNFCRFRVETDRLAPIGSCQTTIDMKIAATLLTFSPLRFANSNGGPNLDSDSDSVELAICRVHASV